MPRGNESLVREPAGRSCRGASNQLSRGRNGTDLRLPGAGPTGRLRLYPSQVSGACLGLGACRSNRRARNPEMRRLFARFPSRASKRSQFGAQDSQLERSYRCLPPNRARIAHEMPLGASQPGRKLRLAELHFPGGPWVT